MYFFLSKCGQTEQAKAGLWKIIIPVVKQSSQVPLGGAPQWKWHRVDWGTTRPQALQGEHYLLIEHRGLGVLLPENSGQPLPHTRPSQQTGVRHTFVTAVRHIVQPRRIQTKSPAFVSGKPSVWLRGLCFSSRTRWAGQTCRQSKLKFPAAIRVLGLRCSDVCWIRLWCDICLLITVVCQLLLTLSDKNKKHH